MPTNQYGTTLRWQSRDSGFAAWVPGSTYIGSTEEWFSLNHFPLNTGTDDGGPWYLTKTLDLPKVAKMKHLKFDGDFTVGFPVGYVYTNPTAPSDSEMITSGTTAIARSAPTNPSFSLATSLGELRREGLPDAIGSSLFKDRVKAARSAGSEYLNVEFGWAPIARDLKQFARSVKDSEKILDHYLKGSDKKIRARYFFPADESYSVSYPTNFVANPASVGSFGSGSLTKSSISRAWFAGAFKYHIPTSEEQLGNFRRWGSMADHLLGVKPTPEVVWNLAPWSWAADWFANCGDVMTNISNLGRDGLVLQYGYSMKTVELTHRMYASFGGIPVSRTISKIYKKRMPASPYGFGVNLQSLSAKQIAVVSALGLSRS
jgi:hypothetical protein